MNEKDLQKELKEKVEVLENVVMDSKKSLNEVAKKVKEDECFDQYLKIGAVASGAALIASYLPLRKKHRNVANIALLLGTGVLAAAAVHPYLKEDEK